MEEQKTIVRVCKSKDNPYVMINKRLIQDPALTAKEKGIVAYILSLPDDWIIHMRELIKHFADGRDSIYSGFRGLVEKGYAERVIIRKPTGQVIRYEYRIFESPEARQSTVYGKPGNGIPVHTNTDLTNTDNLSCKQPGMTRYEWDEHYRDDMDKLADEAKH